MGRGSWRDGDAWAGFSFQVADALPIQERVMSLSYAPIQYEDIPGSDSHGVYRISYGVEYGEQVDPRFVYKVHLVEDGQVVDDMGLSLWDRSGDAARIAKAIAGFIARPHPL
ncbi:hypothetical protein [Bosea sp. TAF32]|uniref:hypothetical protein n=1 Tax=Bosea sp. TAF32 TaxID=3237482 RepID=UPI003F9120AF